MSNNTFMTLHAEILGIIFSFIILEAEDFSTFSKLLMVWAGKCPSSEIKCVLEKVDWDRLYGFHNHAFEVTRDQFYGFVKYSVKHKVVQALFFNSSRELFRIRDIHENLGILQSLSEVHFPSLLCYLFFKSIYVRHEFNIIARDMFVLVNTYSLRQKIVQLMDFLQSMYEYITAWDYLLPHSVRYPHAIDWTSRLKIEGFPNEEGLWNSLCVVTVGHAYHEEDSMDGRPLTTPISSGLAVNVAPCN